MGLRRSRGLAVAASAGLLASLTLIGVQAATPAAGLGLPVSPAGTITTAGQLVSGAGQAVASTASSGLQLPGTGSLLGSSRGAPGTAVLSATFGSPVAVTGGDVGEPGIVVDGAGNIYIDGPRGLPSASPVFKSSDHGATWTETPASLRAAFPGGGDVNVAVDRATGKLYMVDLWLASTTTSRSTDGAQSWVANPLSVPIQDRPWVATSGGGNVYMVTHQVPLGDVVLKSVSPLDGVAYPIPSLAASPVDQEGCVCPPGNIVAVPSASGDQVGFAYTTGDGVKFARSTNGGLSFTNTFIAPDDAAVSTKDAFPVVASAGGQQLYAVWLEDPTDGSTNRVRIATSSDFGNTWNELPVAALSPSGTSVYPWVDASGSKVSISLYHTSSSATASPQPDSVPAGAQWFETYQESTDGGSTFSAPQTVDPTPVKTGPICTGGTSCSANRELLDFQTVTIDPNGLADLAYARVLPGGGVQTMFVGQS